MTSNRTDAARALLTEIEAWCRRTSTPENHIGHILFLHPGFVGLLRKRLTLSEEKEASVRAFMAEHASGWRGALPKTHGNGTKPTVQFKSPFRQQRGPIERSSVEKLSEEEIAARRVSRDCCLRCGVRSDLGCKHSRATA